ncbi:MAG: ATP-binding protein [Helicobacteraceae bacterium]|jgi:signal transduction histidine kinase|nr:ATP-binding protein [Helicobacteraceae bacterium]
MQSQNVLTSFKSLDHPSELILMMTKGIQKGALIATLIGSALFVFLLYDYNPLYILSFWLLAQFILSIVRVNLARKLEKYIKQDDLLKKKYVTYNIEGTMLSAFLWGLTSWLTVLYAPEAYTYYILVLLFALTAGATTTLGSVFRAYFAFMGIILLMLSSSFLYYGGDTHLIIAFASVVAITILTATGSDYYLKLKKIIELSVQLKMFNTALEERVRTEVQKNVDKDIQLMHQARLAQMGEMINLIAHQWRQPLHIIATAATDMDLKIKLHSLDNETSKKHIETINALTQHLSSTIDDFRDFFKVTKVKETTSFKAVVDATLNIVGEYIGNKHITIKTDIKNSDTFKSYPNELKQVLLNLLKNAQDVLLERKIDDAWISIRTFCDEQHLYLEVCDNAGGVPEAILDQIFDAYITSKSQEEGTGLGLYMSKIIIEEHCSGRLAVRNTEEGACFTIRLQK